MLLVAGGTTLAAQGPVITLVSGNYNGYQVRCFGKQNGTINATITGGVAPYQYTWSNGATTEDLSNLPAGYYKLHVMDADSVVAEADITLTEPTPLIALAEPYSYPNGFNVSCFDCYNGSIDVTVAQGVPPYTYLWNDSTTTTQDRNGLGGRKFFVVVTDANSCWVKSETVMLTQPDRDVWSMNGDSGTTPGPQFIGTSDAKDVVLKSNGQEGLRLKSNGEISISSMLGTGAELLYVDSNGILKKGPGGGGPELSIIPWYQGGNNNVASSLNRIGPLNNVDFILMTGHIERMRLTTAGKVGIGVADPLDQLEVHTTLERSGVTLVNDRTDNSAHTEIRFKKGGQARWSLGCDLAGNGGQDFFLWDELHTTTPLRIDGEGRVGIGNVDLSGTSSSLYKLYVEGGIVSRDVKVQVGSFPDFVFTPEYALLPLDELRKHLLTEQHLPGIPSAAQVREDMGVEVGDLQVRMLKVMEEQALYILQLEERIKVLEERQN